MTGLTGADHALQQLVRRLAAPLACAAALIAAPVAGAAQPVVTHTVVIEAMRYEPATLSVNRGDVVVFVNKDPFPHTVTSGRVFDSKPIAAAGKWKYRARTAGTFEYLCTLHPGMKGTLVVR